MCLKLRLYSVLLAEFFLATKDQEVSYYDQSIFIVVRIDETGVRYWSFMFVCMMLVFFIFIWLVENF